jgi:ubiquinone/menaquinone biosynthesis C-methylase UbiE
VVGPTGKVYAEDIMNAYIDQLRLRVRQAGLTNVTVIPGAIDDPKMTANSLDAALLIHMYHEIEQPYALMYRLASAMKPGGKVGIVDKDAPTQAHGTPPALLKCELEAVGYRQASFKVLDGDIGYLAIFTPPPANRLPRPDQIKPCKVR